MRASSKRQVRMKELRQTLIQSIFEVFEKMFYIFLEPSDVHFLGF